jgi:hypothetical protein
MTSTVSTAGSAEDSPHGVVSAAAIEGHRTGHQEREVRPASQEADSLQGSDDDDDNESSTQSESTWLFRAQYKTDELRKLFNLPESEVSVKQLLAPTPQTCNACMHVERALVTAETPHAPPVTVKLA